MRDRRRRLPRQGSLPPPEPHNWQQWLEDRATHREPVDAFFNHACDVIRALGLEMVKAGQSGYMLELGPGPNVDLAEQLRPTPGLAYFAADTRPAGPGVVALEPKWSRERRLPWTNGVFDVILAREVFEHVFDLREMLAECLRILTPGGRLYFSTVYCYPLHDYEPELGGDFWRLSPAGWERLLRTTGFASWEVTVGREMFGSWQYPVSVLAWAEKGTCGDCADP